MMTVKEKKEMPKEPKPPAKAVYVKFTEPNDIQLYAALEAAAKADRRDLGMFILLHLHELRKSAQGAK